MLGAAAYRGFRCAAPPAIDPRPAGADLGWDAHLRFDATFALCTADTAGAHTQVLTPFDAGILSPLQG